jgi:hypothetical protein
MGDKNSLTPAQASESLGLFNVPPEVLRTLERKVEAMLEVCPQPIRLMGSLFLPKSANSAPAREMPAWAREAVQRFIRLGFPTLRLEDGLSPASDSKTDARFLGHVVAFITHFGINKQATSKFPDSISQAILGVSETFAPDVQKGLVQVLQLPLPQVVEFFREFSFALSRTVDETGEMKGETTASVVYLVVALFWPEIEKMRTVEQLHNWLQKLLGSGMAGSLSRTKAMCRHLGLKFAPRGRPKNKDTSESRAVPFSPGASGVRSWRDKSRSSKRTADQAGPLQKRSGGSPRRKPRHG